MHVQGLQDALYRRGYDSLCMELASNKTHQPRPTWEDEVTDISSQVLAELANGRNVFLFLHSAAGRPGCEALNRIVENGGLDSTPGRLLRVIFFSAHHVPEGSAFDPKQLISPAHPGFGIDDDDMLFHNAPFEAFFDDMSKEAAQPYCDACKPMYYYSYGGEVLTTRSWRQVPRTIIGTSKDAATAPALQKQMWSEFEDEMEWIDTKHSPFVAMPDRIAELLISIVTS